jgi:hypothetical protein
MNLEPIDYVIIGVLLILIVIVYRGFFLEQRENWSFTPSIPTTGPTPDLPEHGEPVIPGFPVLKLPVPKLPVTSSPIPVDAEILNLQNEITELEGSINAQRKDMRQKNQNIRNFEKYLQENPQFQDQFKSSVVQARANVAEVRKALNADKGRLDELERKLLNIYQQINVTLRRSLAAARAAAQAATNKNLDDMVEMTVTKMANEIMYKTNGMNWDQAAVKAGKAVENAIKMYAKKYKNINKEQMAKMLGQQAREMINEIMQQIERGVNEVNGVPMTGGLIDPLPSLPSLPDTPIPPIPQPEGSGGFYPPTSGTSVSF